MDAISKIRRGTPREDGLVFFAYDKSSKNGERWVTLEALQAHRLKSVATQKVFRDDPKNKAKVSTYKRRPDVAARRRKLRSKGIGRGNGKRKDALTPEQRKQFNREWKVRQYRINPAFRLGRLVRSRLGAVMRRVNAAKSKTTAKIVGCDWPTLKAHIEAQFKPGMTWSNHAKYGWHIDHKTPLASTNDPEEVMRLCHYTNLQPLWWRDNLTKWAHQ